MWCFWFSSCRFWLLCCSRTCRFRSLSIPCTSITATRFRRPRIGTGFSSSWSRRRLMWIIRPGVMLVRQLRRVWWRIIGVCWEDTVRWRCRDGAGIGICQLLTVISCITLQWWHEGNLFLSVLFLFFVFVQGVQELVWFHWWIGIGLLFAVLCWMVIVLELKVVFVQPLLLGILLLERLIGSVRGVFWGWDKRNRFDACCPGFLDLFCTHFWGVVFFIDLNI